MAFVEIAKIEELEEGKGKLFQVQGKNIAVFKNNGQVFALANQCAHRGGPLCEGTISEECVQCPWHGFEFDLSTGKSPTGLGVQKYIVKIEDQKVLVDV